MCVRSQIVQNCINYARSKRLSFFSILNKDVVYESSRITVHPITVRIFTNNSNNKNIARAYSFFVLMMLFVFCSNDSCQKEHTFSILFFFFYV